MTVDSPQPTVQRLLGQTSASDGDAMAARGGSSNASRPGGAKARILETADRLFSEEGLHSVGVDRLIAAASVTKATFYKHYGSKDNLILAYMHARHTSVVTAMEALVATSSNARAALRAWIAAVADATNASDFQGCAFLNAAAEYHDARHPVREVVSMHRDWYTDRLAALLHDAGHPLPGDGADELMLARDGAMVGAYAGDAIAATTALARVAERVLPA